jgi:hypothetical protein
VQTRSAIEAIPWHHSNMKNKAKSSKVAASATESKPSAGSRKLGANRGETAKRPRKLDKNFKQSKDVREDRGVRQLKDHPKTKVR